MGPCPPHPPTPRFIPDLSCSTLSLVCLPSCTSLCAHCALCSGHSHPRELLVYFFTLFRASSQRGVCQKGFPELTLQPGVSGGANGKEPACHFRRCKRCGFNPWVRNILWRRVWQPTLGQRSLVGYGPQGLRVWHDWRDLAHMHPSSPYICVNFLHSTQPLIDSLFLSLSIYISFLSFFF